VRINEIIIETFVNNPKITLEGEGSNVIRNELEKLQAYWVANKEEFLRRGIYPILERPFDRIIRNGIMVLGMNHAYNESYYNRVMQQINNDPMKAVYDKQTKTWLMNFNGDLSRKRTNDLNIFLNKQWIGSPKKPTRSKDLSQDGPYFYHATFNKILEKLGLDSYKSKLYAMEFIPYGSVNQGPLTPEIWKLCTPWFNAFLSVSRPSLIFTSFKVLGQLQRLYPYQKMNLVHSKYSKNFNRLLETGYINGIPIVALPHWSGAFGLKPHLDKTIDDDAETLRTLITSLVK
jgi:hypothetical protein